MRMSVLIVSELPRRSNERVSRTRSSLTCVEGDISEISSRKMVPPSAASKRPMRLATASVKAPFSWPKSSLSRRLPLSAAHSTATKGPFARGERAWSACATSSLPVPLGPSISTVACVGAAWRMRWNTFCIASEVPVMSLRPCLTSSSLRSDTTSSSNARVFSAFATRRSSWSRSTGFVRKSSAPSFIASTARSTEPNAVRRMQARFGRIFFAAFRSWMPSAPGMRTSESMRAIDGSASSALTACSASAAVVTR